MPNESRSRPAPTMLDVAHAAGVSKASVSIVFRGVEGVSEATREKVMAAAQRLGYRNNRSASLLSRVRSRQLGVVMDLQNAYHSQIAAEVLRAADDAGYQVMFCPRTEQHAEREAITAALEFRCEALLLIGSELSEAELLELAQGTVLISLGRDMDSAEITSVFGDDRLGMELLVDHLVGLGHRRIAHIDGGSSPVAQARRDGFEQAMRRHRLFSHAVTAHGGATEADGRRAAQSLLARRHRPTAIAAFNDHCALGAVEVLLAAGVGIPQDVSITGYDDTPVSRLQLINLTSVLQDPAELANLAVDAAVGRLEGAREAHRLLSPPALRPRGSSGQAPEPAARH